MKLIILSPEQLKTYPMTSVHSRTSGEGGYKFHCDATVLEESDSGFRLLCRSACVVGCGYSFYRPDPYAIDQYREVEMWEERIVVRLPEDKSKDYGYIYAGRYL